MMQPSTMLNMNTEHYSMKRPRVRIHQGMPQQLWIWSDKMELHLSSQSIANRYLYHLAIAIIAATTIAIAFYFSFTITISFIITTTAIDIGFFCVIGLELNQIGDFILTVFPVHVWFSSGSE